MRVMYKIASTIAFLLLISSMTNQVIALELLGGGGSAADKLLLDWSNAKLGSKTKSIRFTNTILSNDLTMLQNDKVDFAIIDNPINEAELARMSLVQIPFALSGISVVVNLKNTMESTLRLDSSTLGKIFSGEITKWDDPAIIALNPRLDLQNQTITIVHSDESSSDYSAFNNYIGNINDKWKAGDLSAQKRVWPANSIDADGFTARISSIKKTSYSISYLPMQYMPQPSLSAVHLMNRDGSYTGLSDTGIIASAASANVEDGQSASLSLINKNGRTSWPISNFSFIVINKNKLRDEKTTQLFNVILYGLKFAAIKPMEHNYVALPDQISKSVIAKIETIMSESSKGAPTRAAPVKSAQENAQEAIANKKRSDEEALRLRNDPAAMAQEANRRIEEKNRAARLLADEIAREQAIKEAKAAKRAADEAIKAANLAKAQADQLAEKNRLIAQAEKDKADKEKAEKERIANEKAEKERAIQLRNQKDEDPLEAYRRSMSK